MYKINSRKRHTTVLFCSEGLIPKHFSNLDILCLGQFLGVIPWTRANFVPAL